MISYDYEVFRFCHRIHVICDDEKCYVFSLFSFIYPNAENIGLFCKSDGLEVSVDLDKMLFDLRLNKYFTS